MRSRTCSPSQRGALHLLASIAVSLCLLVAYTATWGHAGPRFPSGVMRLSLWGDGDGDPAPETQSDHGFNSAGDRTGSGGDDGFGSGAREHPIEALMRTAEQNFDAVLKADPKDLEDAARRYRARRGRHPPPGFDAWFAFAQAKKALVPEVFFDQIYHDLGPFWGMDVLDLQSSVKAFNPKVTVRNGAVGSASSGLYERVRDTIAMLEELVKQGVELPGVDVPVNTNGEVAMLVPWETMETAFEFARAFMPPPHDVISTFSPRKDEELGNAAFDPKWLDARLRHSPNGPYLGPRPFWSLVRPACPSDSAARKKGLMADIWNTRGHVKAEHSAAALLPLEFPVDSEEGYVRNWTVATDVCRRPALQGLYGGFVAPKTMSVTKKLFPLFSAVKLGAGNEILFPDMRMSNASTLTPGIPWEEKERKLHWRGPASGGVNSELNWRRMHRHRFVSMLNATHVEIAEAMLHAGNESTVGLGYVKNFRLLPANQYHLDTQKGARMAEWASGWADVGFTDLNCDQPTEDGTCSYVNEFFSVKLKAEESEEGGCKFASVLDGDGGDEGGELVQRLVEGSVVLRASVYRQWYDYRLIPWSHFVPMDNTFVDLYGIMEFFLGTSTPSPAPVFSHAHVEVEKHEHHFETPHWDEINSNGVNRAEHVADEHDRKAADRRGEVEGDGSDGHDPHARRIAEAGQEWANKVLRREDMLVYVYRLLLEYARVVDEKRHTLGWVGDLLKTGK